MILSRRVGQIVKSLVFRGSESGRAPLVIAGGANRVDEARLAELVGEPVERPDADFVRAGSWAAAGTPFAVFRLDPADLERMTGGRVARVKL